MTSVSVVCVLLWDSIDPVIVTRASVMNGGNCEFVSVIWRPVVCTMDTDVCIFCFNERAGSAAGLPDLQGGRFVNSSSASTTKSKLSGSRAASRRHMHQSVLEHGFHGRSAVRWTSISTADVSG